MTEQQLAEKWTIMRLLQWTTDYFDRSQVADARLCAEILLAWALGIKRIELYTRFDYCPKPEELGKFREMVKRCAAQEPVAYLTGTKDFYSMTFAVSSAVLIPRPETEVLVAEALGFVRDQRARPVVKVLELGVGSGCVSAALAQHSAEVEIVGVDISGQALEVARQNIEKYELQDRISLRQGDLFDGLDGPEAGGFDLIVSNPPYIAPDKYEKLDDNVRKYEPKQALWADNNGLEFYQRILERADDYLAEDGGLMVEVGYDQADEVVKLFESAGYLGKIDTALDQGGHRRVVKGLKVIGWE